MTRHTITAILFALSAFHAHGDVKVEYDNLKKLTGTEYRVAREAFLKNSDAREHLKSALEQGHSWQALALYFSLTKPAAAQAVTKALRLKASRLKTTQTLYAFANDAASFASLASSPGKKPSSVVATVEMHIAICIEYLVRNPDGMSNTKRLWTGLSVFGNIPTNNAQAERFVEFNIPQPMEVKFDLHRLRKWLSEEQESADHVIALVAAQQLMSDRSVTILKKLSSRKDFIGVLAGLFCAGRFAEGKPHRFDGEWLETWIKGLDKRRLEYVAAILSGNSDGKKPAEHKQAANLLDIPISIATLCIRRHPTTTPNRLKSLYASRMHTDFEGFIVLAQGIKETVGKNDQKTLIQFARWRWRSYPCWPKDGIAKLKKARTGNTEYDKMLKQAIDYLSTRKGDYPSGKELGLPYLQK